jgi:hypothetical protein
MRVRRPKSVRSAKHHELGGYTDAQEQRNQFQNADFFLPLVHSSKLLVNWRRGVNVAKEAQRAESRGVDAV